MAWTLIVNDLDVDVKTILINNIMQTFCYKSTFYDDTRTNIMISIDDAI